MWRQHRGLEEEKSGVLLQQKGLHRARGGVSGAYWGLGRAESEGQGLSGREEEINPEHRD